MTDKRDRELNDELATHLRMAAQDKMDGGASPEEAETAARREMGNTGLIKEVTREQDGWRGPERFVQDLRFGFRMLKRNPGFAVVSVLTLALGIGASASIFSVVYGVLLRPLPYYKADQIVRVWEQTSAGQTMDLADENFADFRSQNTSFQGIAEFKSSTQSISGSATPKRVTLARVSHDFLPIMSVTPVRGRGFLPEDQRQNAAPVVLVSYSYWRDELGGREDLSALQLKIGDHSANVVGVLPPGFHFPDDSDVWMPRELFEVLPVRDAHNWKGLGRLKDGVSLQKATAELVGMAQRIKLQYGDKTNMSSVEVLPLRTALTGDVNSALMVLLGAVGLLLLVACANVMNLMLAQATTREGELATRTALGASRGRLVRQFLVESLLLCLAGGFAGVFAAIVGVRALLQLAPASLPRAGEVSVNTPVLLFALGLCCLIAVALGTFTAMRATSGDPQAALAESSRRQSRGKDRAGRLIIALQLGLTMVLLVGAGLLGRSLLHVLSVDPGFQTEQIVTVDMALPEADLAAAKAHQVQFLDNLLGRLRSVPGVISAGATNSLPLAGSGSADGAFVVLNEEQLSPEVKNLIQRTANSSTEMQEPDLKEMIAFLEGLFHDPTHTGDADYTVASDDYFQTLGIPVKRGRTFLPSDGPDSPHVAVISESTARQRWPNEDPIGRTIEFGNMDGDLRLLHIVGIVGDVKERSLERPVRPTIYVTYRQRPQSTRHLSIVLRTKLAEAALIPSARKIIADLDPSIPPRFATFQQVFANSLVSRRFNLTLITTFAVAALALAMIGIYGVLAYSVARRTREMGVRIALGATPGKVRKLILKQALMTALLGVGAGIVAAYAMTRLLQSMLFGVKATDPITFAMVTSLLLVIALLAAYVPARRATKVDPMIALRYE
jgi:putative ABC transport system permease protein